MIRRVAILAVLLGVAALLLKAQPGSKSQAGRGDTLQSTPDNRLFDYLKERSDLSVCRNWRTKLGTGSSAYAACDYKSQLDSLYTGRTGDLNGTLPQVGEFVSYDYANDTDPEKQDATRIDIPNWISARTGEYMPIVETPVPASSVQNCTQTIDFRATGTGGGIITGNVGVVGTHFRLDDEIIEVCAWNNATKVMTVKRAMFGSAGVAHSAGTVGRMATHSLQTQLRTQVNLASGETGASSSSRNTTLATRGSGTVTALEAAIAASNSTPGTSVCVRI